MKKFKITAQISGVTKYDYVYAKDINEAYELAWEKGYEDAWVSEVKEG